MRTILLATTFLCAISASALAAETVPVTAYNFIRAETDNYFKGFVTEAGGLSKFHHDRAITDVAHQTVIRMNRDTVYSFAVVDLDAGPVTLTMPTPDGGRFMSVMLVNEDHYIVGDVLYGGGTHTISKDDAGTRYLALTVRTLIDPNDPADAEKVHALQDQMKLTQKTAGSFDAPTWDEASLTATRNALLELGRISSIGTRAFGSKEEVDPIEHLIGTAVGWGGNPPDAATYGSGTPPKNDGKTVYKLHVTDVPVDGFWSISVYNAKGFFEPNDLNAYSVNNITGKKSADGAVDIQFGGCDGKIPNCLPIMNGWNYAIRLYRPRAEILDGTWKFPEAHN